MILTLLFIIIGVSLRDIDVIKIDDTVPYLIKVPYHQFNITLFGDQIK
jgi:hypothetical protein